MFPAGTRDLPKMHQGTSKPDDMDVDCGVSETVAASQVQFRIGPHVPLHVLVRSGLGH